MPDRTLIVFDPNITENSPAGSCLLKMLRAASDMYRLELFAVTIGLQATDRIRIHKFPLPHKPILIQNILFTLLSILYGFFQKHALRIGTQGAHPFCEIAYSHNPHKLFLTRYRDKIGGRFFTRLARILNYHWIASLERVAFEHARVIVVPSQGLADDIADSYSAAVAAKLHVIPNPVDCKAFLQPANNQRTVRPFTFAFCALGKFEWKGLGLILDAMSTGIDAHLKVIGGNDSEIRQFSAIAKRYGLTQKVTFTGMQRDVRPDLWSSDVFVFPSVYESFGLVCFQAAAAGLPLIATNLYSLDELLKPGISGWRVERTAECIAAAMQDAIANPARTTEWGRNAQQLAQSYDEALFQQRWLELLSQTSLPELRSGS